MQECDVKNDPTGHPDSDSDKKIRLPVLLGIRLHPKTSDCFRLRLRNPGYYKKNMPCSVWSISLILHNLVLGQSWKVYPTLQDNCRSCFLAALKSVCNCASILFLTAGELTATNANAKIECALFGAELVRAIFRSSLPHPTADFDYASYEIIPSTVDTSLNADGKRFK